MTTITLISGLASFPQHQLLDLVFPKQITHPILAYIPPNGHHSPEKFTRMWKKMATQRKAQFLFIDITSPNPKVETQKLLSANILLLTGGNTFTFLHHLRKSNLDKVIIQFALNQTPNSTSNTPPGLAPNKPPRLITSLDRSDLASTPGVDHSKLNSDTPKHIAAFSAGALILTPSIKIASLPPHPDKNTLGLKDFTGLNLVHFEIFPHFRPEYQPILEKYQKTGLPQKHPSTTCHPQKTSFAYPEHAPSSSPLNNASRKTSHPVIPLPDGQVITHQLQSPT